MICHSLVVTNIRGGAGIPEDRGGAGGTGNEGVAEKAKAELDVAKGARRSMADQGEAGETREPGEAIWPMVSCEAEGGRSQGGAEVSTGRGGEIGTEARGGTRGSSVLG